jgi:molybdate transport system ATP-binding protein
MNAFRICFNEAEIGPAGRPIFRHFSWSVEPFQAWVVTGSNGSGKSAIAQALAGGLPAAPAVSRAASEGGSTGQGTQLPAPETVALISFERQRDVVFDERYHDDSEFVDGGVDPGTSAQDFILGRPRGGPAVPAPARLAQLVQRLGIAPLMARGLKYLSTGEIRKVLLARELLAEPALLIFDEPYEGLDTATRRVLSEELERLVSASVSEPGATQVIVISDRYEHVPSATTHVLHLENAQIVYKGTRAEFEARGIPAQLKRLDEQEAATLNAALEDTLEQQLPSVPVTEADLVVMRDVTVTYGERRVLEHLNLNVQRGAHTLVRGPNGCGKTTLLNLINGDNPQVYANDVTVCGMKRGSGESVWDVKKRLGQVSYALHVEYAYRCQANLLETVLSGFFDSIGLYRAPTYAEIRAAERWLGVVNLLDKRAQLFTELSYGEQRVALILRAVVKQPPLLILDEPCHGLDARHRSEVLTIADYIGKNSESTLLYVTHDPAEQLTCTRQVFEFTAERGWLLSAV